MTDTPEEGTPTFRINMKKLNVETALEVGRVSELQELANLFAGHANKTLDLRERGVLQKVSETLLRRHKAAQIRVFKLARKCNAVDVVMPAPTVEQ